MLLEMLREIPLAIAIPVAGISVLGFIVDVLNNRNA